VEVYIQRRFL